MFSIIAVVELTNLDFKPNTHLLQLCGELTYTRLDQGTEWRLQERVFSYPGAFSDFQELCLRTFFLCSLHRFVLSSMVTVLRTTDQTGRVI